ncbi:hypothetical protein [Actinomycetospora sp. NBC_00405]|uniref:hypothetical protein n=1 Tax=Actinomycetospora sp. NBC_00405 TaxID=2975952 RepID=UPI002E227109
MAISLAVTPSGLRMRFTGVDRVAACSRGIDVSFERIVGSRVMSRAEAVASSPHVPCPGSWWPGRLRAGSWGIGERRQLWGVRRSPRVIVVYLSGRPFHRLVVDVEEPDRTHRVVEAALLHSKKTQARRSVRGLLSGPDAEGSGRSSTAP